LIYVKKLALLVFYPFFFAAKESGETKTQ